MMLADLRRCPSPDLVNAEAEFHEAASHTSYSIDVPGRFKGQMYMNPHDAMAHFVLESVEEPHAENLKHVKNFVAHLNGGKATIVLPEGCSREIYEAPTELGNAVYANIETVSERVPGIDRSCLDQFDVLDKPEHFQGSGTEKFRFKEQSSGFMPRSKITTGLYSPMFEEAKSRQENIHEFGLRDKSTGKLVATIMIKIDGPWAYISDIILAPHLRNKPEVDDNPHIMQALFAHAFEQLRETHSEVQHLWIIAGGLPELQVARDGLGAAFGCVPLDTELQTDLGLIFEFNQPGPLLNMAKGKNNASLEATLDALPDTLTAEEKDVLRQAADSITDLEAGMRPSHSGS